MKMPPLKSGSAFDEPKLRASLSKRVGGTKNLNTILAKVHFGVLDGKTAVPGATGAGAGGAAAPLRLGQIAPFRLLRPGRYPPHHHHLTTV